MQMNLVEHQGRQSDQRKSKQAWHNANPKDNTAYTTPEPPLPNFCRPGGWAVAPKLGITGIACWKVVGVAAELRAELGCCES
jgi:hypothetical protein